MHDAEGRLVQRAELGVLDAQLVGALGDPLLEPFEGLAQLPGHRVERLGERADLVVRRHRRFACEVAGGDGGRGLGDGEDRLGDATREQVGADPEQADDEQAEAADRETEPAGRGERAALTHLRDKRRARSRTATRTSRSPAGRDSRHRGRGPTAGAGPASIALEWTAPAKRPVARRWPMKRWPGPTRYICPESPRPVACSTISSSRSRLRSAASSPISWPSWLKSGVAIVIVGSFESDDRATGSTTVTPELASTKYFSWPCALPSSRLRRREPHDAVLVEDAVLLGVGRLADDAVQDVERGVVSTTPRRRRRVGREELRGELLQLRIAARLRAAEELADEHDVPPLVVDPAVDSALLLLDGSVEAGVDRRLQGAARAQVGEHADRRHHQDGEHEERADEPDHEGPARQLQTARHRQGLRRVVAAT